MSIQAMAAVLEDVGSEVQGLDRLVLLSLANHANDVGECWPSVATICREVAAHDKSVRRALGRLAKGGWIERFTNAAPDLRIPGNKRPNLYRLGRWSRRVEHLDPPSPIQGGTSRSPGWGIPSPQGGTSGPTKPSLNHKEPRRGSPQAGNKGARFSPGVGELLEFRSRDSDPAPADTTDRLEQMRAKIRGTHDGIPKPVK